MPLFLTEFWEGGNLGEHGPCARSTHLLRGVGAAGPSPFFLPLPRHCRPVPQQPRRARAQRQVLVHYSGADWHSYFTKLSRPTSGKPRAEGAPHSSWSLGDGDATGVALTHWAIISSSDQPSQWITSRSGG